MSARERLAAVKQEIGAGRTDEAYRLLKSAVGPADDFSALSKASRMLEKLPADTLGLKPLRIALVGSSTFDQFADLLRLWLGLEGFAPEIWIAPFDTVVPTVLDLGSELYAFQPDIVWLFSTYRDVRLDLAMGDAAGVGAAVDSAVGQRALLWKTIKATLDCTVIENNADIPAGDPMGNFAGQVAWSRRNALRRYNLALADAAPSGVLIFDLDHLSGQCGKLRWTDDRYWYHSKNAVDFELLGTVAFHGARMIASLKGLARKCVVLDLDNTLWGGVIGDDGIEGVRLGTGGDGEAFVDVQRWAKALKARGIILAVCSKNEADIARHAFENHPDMQLSLDDIAVFRANWDNKADNIRFIAQTLNIGLDALVFVDDNPVERNLVRHHLPMVAVPELPVDPSGYIKAIEAELYFETVAFSAEDGERARYYKDNAARAEQMATFTDQSEYLAWLDMTSETGGADAFNLPRMAQLVGKSNQFNLTTMRYTESDLAGFAARGDMAVRRYGLIDRYGDNGLISVVVLEGSAGGPLEVKLWVMSCRVLARTMEEYIANDILATAQAMGCVKVIGRYRPTPKNKLVSGLYARLGFEKLSDSDAETVWQLAVEPETAPRVTFVRGASVRETAVPEPA